MSTCQNEIEFDLPVVSQCLHHKIYFGYNLCWYKYECAEKSLQYLNIADDRNNWLPLYGVKTKLCSMENGEIKTFFLLFSSDAQFIWVWN